MKSRVRIIAAITALATTTGLLAGANPAGAAHQITEPSLVGAGCSGMTTPCRCV
jgi:hypothetical protein